MRTTFAGLVALAAVGCAHAPATHAPAGTRWVELTSRHFTLRTDLGRRQARAALADFEGVYGTLETIAFAGDAPRDRIDVILFTDEDRFRQVAPGGAAGYFMPRQAEDPDPQPTIVIHGRMLIAGTLVEATQRRFRHELTHRFLDHRLRWTPPWLEEGLAEYYSTLSVQGADAIVGTLPNTKILRVDIHIESSLIGALTEDRVDLADVPTVQRLLSADFATFHDRAHELAYYAGAWTFVHMMLNGPYGYTPHFQRFLDLLGGGATPVDAWRQCFWSVPLWRLERDFRRYVMRTGMDPHAIAVAVPKAKRPESERVMTPEELHLMLARIRPWDSRESILAAGAELAEARRLAGTHASAELRYWSGVYALRWRHFDEAARELRAAVALEPGRSRFWLALADALERDDRGDGNSRLDRAAQLDDAVAHLVPLATSAHALDFLARYYSGRGQIDAGLPYAERAVATERSCWECEETLSTLQNLARAAMTKSADDATGDETAPNVKPTID
ncbi:MAG TPA: hypothetical protein VHB97_20820 [Polyangia bacterium]|nr:hypothetical protein [Polyangia bacterium]